MILASRLRLAVVASTFLPTARAFSAIPPKRSILCASQNYYYNKRSIGIQMAFSAWIACPSCHGEGKRFRAPSKKAQLKHKRTKLDNTDTRLPPRLEPCRNCQQTGIILQDDSSKLSIEKFPRVAIIGGGLGGFALGIACSHRGIPFSIFERDTSFLMRAQGYGLTLQQASRALASFGIQSLPEGVTSTRHVVHTTDGTVVGEWGLRKWGRDATKKPPKRQNIHISRQAVSI